MQVARSNASQVSEHHHSAATARVRFEVEALHMGFLLEQRVHCRPERPGADSMHDENHSIGCLGVKLIFNGHHGNIRAFAANVDSVRLCLNHQRRCMHERCGHLCEKVIGRVGHMSQLASQVEHTLATPAINCVARADRTQHRSQGGREGVPHEAKTWFLAFQLAAALPPAPEIPVLASGPGPQWCAPPCARSARHRAA